MKKYAALLTLLGTVCVMTGCASKVTFGVDGYNHGSKKDIVRVVFKDPVGGTVAPEHLSQLKLYPKTALIRNKRVAVLTGSKGTLSAYGDHDVVITPAVEYTCVDAPADIGEIDEIFKIFSR